MPHLEARGTPGCERCARRALRRPSPTRTSCNRSWALASFPMFFPPRNGRRATCSLLKEYEQQVRRELCATLYEWRWPSCGSRGILML